MLEVTFERLGHKRDDLFCGLLLLEIWTEKTGYNEDYKEVKPHLGSLLTVPVKLSVSVIPDQLAIMKVKKLPDNSWHHPSSYPSLWVFATQVPNRMRDTTRLLCDDISIHRIVETTMLCVCLLCVSLNSGMAWKSHLQ